MMFPELHFQLGQTTWVLNHQKAAYLPEHQLLILSDVHMGKVQHFRKNGIAVPGQVAQQNFKIMVELIEKYAPSGILFLGDLFHSKENAEHQLLEQLHSTYPQITLFLVPGNHDEAMLQQLPSYLRHTNLQHRIDRLIFSHHPPEVLVPDHFHCYGHLHPAVEVRGSARQKLKFPGFIFNTAALVMPAFGTFTGSVTGNKLLKQANHALCTPEGLWLVENHKFS